MENLENLIILALIGFFILAFLVLWPVYRFIKKQERLGEAFTRAVLEGQHRVVPGDGEPSSPDIRPESGANQG